MATSQKEAKEELLQKRQMLLKEFDDQTAAEISTNKGKWLEEFIGIEREIQQTEKASNTESKRKP